MAQKRVLPITTFDVGPIVGPTSVAKQTPLQESVSQNFALGTKLVDGDRAWRYSRADATGIAKALMTQTHPTTSGTLELASFKEIVQTGHAFAVGDLSGSCLVTTGSAAAVDDFKDGYMFVNKSTGIGDIYKVVASKLRATDTIIDIELETPIRTATVAGSTEITIQPNKYYGTVVYPVASTGLATGVPLVGVTASYYYWGQTAGPCPLIVDTSETVVIGQSVGNAAATAVVGACGVRLTLEEIWGNVLSVGAAAEPALVDLCIDTV